MFIALSINVKGLAVEIGLRSVIHSEHDCHDRRLVSEDIALESRVNAAAAAASDPIAAPAGVNERDIHLRKTRDNVGFRERCVEALIGDAVAVKDDAVTVFEVES